MFDGAAAVAATDPNHQADASKAPEAPAAAERTTSSATRTEAAVASVASAPAAPTAPAHSLLVVDSRVEQQEMLSAQAGPGVTVLVVGTNQDGLAAISAALASLGQVDSIQILSHGAAGQFTLGNRTISSDNIDQLAGQLKGWSAELTPGADIQLYGCNVGAGPAGQTLVNELARLTGADVGASSDATGSAAEGGNWTLETRAGDVDKALALSAVTVESFQGLLADAAPTVTLSSGGSDVLLGDTFTYTASFTNPSSQVGFAPYIDLYVPTTGRDGAGSAVDDGITFQSATFQGVAIKTFDIVFDVNGQAAHPLAKGTDGKALVINAADYGLRAGDHLVVLQLPNASIVSGQPAIDIVVTMKLSNLADTSLTDAAPNLTVKARGGFQFGNTSADDSTIDPTLVEAGTHDFVVHPTMVDLTMTHNIPDGQTVTGPNYPRSITITASTASDQTLTNVKVEQDLPNTIKVTSIVPGANGSVTSITLQDGTVITDAATITSTLAAGAYLKHFEVTYASLTGSQDTTVNFFVPDVDSNGQQILDPTTGAPRTITIDGTDASAQWIPLDTRDVPLDPNATLSGTGDPISFQVLSMVVYKPVPAVTTDVGTRGPTPGDTLTYTLDVNISDYFAFGRDVVNNGQLVISDVATDGQTLVPGSGTLTVFIGGQQFSMTITPTVTVNADGTTSMSLDIAQTLRDNGRALAALVGDLAFDNVLQGATKATITYQMTVGQFYGTPSDVNAINEGDTIGNNAVITGTVLVDPITTGGTVSDGDSASVTVPTSTVDIQVMSVDGTDVSGNPSVELHPGDVVTFQLSYDLVTGDYQDFNLRAYLPLPLFDVNGINWSEFTGSGDPGVNQWSYGPGHTLNDTAGSVVGVVNGNYVVFDFGDHSSLQQTGSRVELRFTMVVGDNPFGDARKVTVIGQSNQVTTLDNTPIVSQDAAVINSIAEPSLTITHGVVSSSSPDAVITGTTGTWAPPGDTTSPPFTLPLTETTNVNGDVTGIDGGDLLRLATAIENSGGGGAFDVSTRIDLPTGVSFVGGSLASTLRVIRGDGTILQEGLDYAVNGNVVTFLDPVQAQASLPAGRPGSLPDASGANLIVLLYDVKVDDAIAASSTLQSQGVLTHYASVKGGEDFVPDGADIIEKAGEQISAPTVKVVYAGGALDNGDSSSASTTGSDLVVGETMDYDIVVTLPEGTTSNLRIDELIPPGMALDMSFNGGQGYQIIQTVAGSAALTADFGGTLVGANPSGLGGTVGQDGVDARLSFTASTNNADNVGGNNSFVIRVRLVASNTQDNQAGRVLNNNVQLVYSDPDGDQAGGTAVDRTVANSGADPSVTVAEPTLTLTQTAVATGSTLGVDQGNTVTYTIVIGNNSGVDAYDVTFNDAFPTTLLTGLSLMGVTFNGSVTTNGLDFVLDGNGVLRNADGAKIDIGNGGSITLVVRGTVTAAAVNFQSIDDKSSVQWTSINGAAPVTSAGGERTGTDGLLNTPVLNDYRVEATTQVKVLSGIQVSRIGGMADTPSADNGTTTDGAVEQVAVGEIIRYRVVSAVGEGVTDSYRVQVTLDAGLSFIGDNTIKIAIVSNGGVTSNVILNSDGTLAVVGNRSSAIAQPIPGDLSNGPDATLATGRWSVSTVGGQTVVVFDLGTITNADNDNDVTDLEGVVIEFNARVSNATGNQNGVVLGVTAAMLASDNTIGARDSVSEQVIEPSFTGLVKQVESFTPNANGGANSTADMSVSFTQNGTGPAYDVTLDDAMFPGTTYTLNSVTIIRADGTTTVLAPGDFAANGITNTSDAAGIHLSVAKVDVGTRVVVGYTVTVETDTAYAGTDAVLKWSSLPESFTNWGGTLVGADASADGERDGSDGALNDYVLSEGAGLGLIHGNLWDDSLSATSDLTPDGAALAGQTVTLRGAGADGVMDTGDDLVFTTVTDSAGFFHFSALAAGTYRVEVPTPIVLAQPTGELRVRLDTDGATLGQVNSSVGEGATQRGDFGYVQINDAPINSDVPGPQSVNEDELLNIPPFAVRDVDLNQGPAPGVLDVTLSVLHGVLNYTATPPAGLTLHEGEGTGTIHLIGTAADINAILQTLTYQGLLNYNGADTLTITTKDGGSFGDVDGDGIPGEPVEDQLQDVDTIAINVIPVNDPPQGHNDEATAVEAGGFNNGTPGVNPTLNVLDNDTDVDITTNNDVLHLVSVTGSGGTTQVTDGTTEFAIVGNFGTLFVRANGAARYEVDNSNAQVQALRTTGNSLTEDFSYVLADLAGAQSGAILRVTIQGANDTPIGRDDAGPPVNAATAGTPGQSTGGNVLVADGNGSVSDVDVDQFGEALSVSGVRNVPKDQAGAITPVSGGPVTIQGTYGDLTINPDGSYTYTVVNNRAATVALAGGQQVQDVFSYQVTDLGGLSSLANLSITVIGSNDAPVAGDDAATAAEAGGIANGRAGTNPSGNVLTNDTDADVDPVSGQQETLTVTAVRTGQESGTGTPGTVGQALQGKYGTLTLNPDGSYTYVVDNNNAEVQALRLAGDTLQDFFTYTAGDPGGLGDSATLTITIQGANDTPVAQDDIGNAIEAGGVNNGTVGSPATGNVLGNDADVDGGAGDPIDYGETQAVQGYAQGTNSATVGSALAGAFGSLVIAADGSYTYTVDEKNVDVQALRRNTDTLVEVFTYTMQDALGATSTATLTITIHGRNDAPVGNPDADNAVEAGGLNNSTAGSPASGNVLTNDTDVDAFNETKTVQAFDQAGAAGTVGTAFNAQFGTLTLNADGSYTYVVNDSNAAVQALRLSTDTLTEVFNYTVVDASGATSTTTLTITIHGANDTPVANNDVGTAVEAGGTNNGTPGSDATGNVLTGDANGGVADTDVDGASYGETRTVQGYTYNATSAPGTVGSAFTANFGTLTLNADGSYTYVVDNANATVQALAPGQSLIERFTYTMRDTAGATSVATLTITIQGADDTPSAVDDTATAIEAGGIANATPGTNPTGNVLGNDGDIDNPGADLSVSAVRTGPEAGTGTAGTVGVALQGQFGTLTLNVDGSYTYVVDNNNATVQALRQSGDTLLDFFTYTVKDLGNLTDTAQLVVTIQGANDNPVAHDDAGTAVEAGGVANGTAGSNATGNVLNGDASGGVADTDVDAFGETRAVQGFVLDATSSAGTVGTAFNAQFGTLTLNADGSYTYVVDNANATVQALLPGQTLPESFTYTMVDALGATSTARLTITIRGANDNPVARDETATAVEAGGVNNGTPGTNPGGNVISDNNSDTDVDHAQGQLRVTAVRTGAESGSGTAGTVGQVLQGQYGTLTLNADGSYTYLVDNSNATVQALRRSGDTLTDVFTYTVSDPLNASDTAQLTVTIQGANDNPVARDDVADAVEAGGIANGTAGTDPGGNVLANDTDVDQFGETKAVQGFSQGASNGTLGTGFTAQFGTLTLNADGTWSYVVDNANATVQGLRTDADTLTEVFSYTMVDALGATSTATLTITIHGRNDNPVAQDDVANPVEAGGTFNGTPGTDPSGNVLTNDTDVDNADPRLVNGIRTGAEGDGGTFTQVAGATVVQGLYGTLTIGIDGGYTYVVDNSLAAVQALRQGDSLVESFTYQARDLAGATDAARLTVTIHGAWDAPVAVDDANVAAAGTIRDPSKGLDAVGNVLPNDTDVDANDTKTVTAIGVGAESSNPALTAVAQPDQPVQGLYGRLLINADGSYTYTVDVLNLTVQALQPGQTLDEYFTYQVSDAGNLNDTATLHIVVRGINNPPFTLPDQGDAVEAGGLDNGTPGVNPRGNVLANDIDLDGDALTITGIRTGPELGTGTDGTVGQVLHGQYGDLLILANGDWSYVVNNSLAAVQALRISGQTLEESFTYTVADIRGDTDTGLLRIVIDGRNDTPLAHDDAGEALEAGGIDNGTPGKDSVGNVLDNDTDVDSVANGESRHVVNYTSAAGVVGDAGSTVAGIYGSLVIGADGSWRYVVDNNNAAVQALRTNGETLTESFSYLMRDTEGATSRANLVIVVRGANDNPVARDDSNVASDQVVAPQATGNVLPNDSDVDGGDALHVSAIRTGAEGASGTAGQLGQALAGRYGTLVIHADGSYTYSIDLSNPEVLAAAGMGRVLQDLFTYTVSDRAGATDLAQLTISLDISAPRIDNGDPLYFQRLFERLQPHTQELGYEPAIFVQPVVRQSAFIDRLEQASSDGTRLDMVLDRGLIAPPSLGANLGQLAGQFVGQVVRENQLAAQLELARLTGRHGRVSLGADGLLSDPSTFSLTDDGLTKGEAQRPGLDGPAPAARPAADARSGERNKQKQARATTAPGFSEQLRRAAGQASPTHR